MSRLGMDVQTLSVARQNLIKASLVAYEDPLYQVLSLEPWLEDHQSPQYLGQSKSRVDGPVSIGRLFKQILGENQ